MVSLEKFRRPKICSTRAGNAYNFEGCSSNPDNSIPLVSCELILIESSHQKKQVCFKMTFFAKNGSITLKVRECIHKSLICSFDCREYEGRRYERYNSYEEHPEEESSEADRAPREADRPPREERAREERSSKEEGRKEYESQPRKPIVQRDPFDDTPSEAGDEEPRDRDGRENKREPQRRDKR